MGTAEVILLFERPNGNVVKAEEYYSSGYEILGTLYIQVDVVLDEVLTDIHLG